MSRRQLTRVGLYSLGVLVAFSVGIWLGARGLWGRADSTEWLTLLGILVGAGVVMAWAPSYGDDEEEW
jgi:uncharacterized membrane protein YcjF (UPF0283 family)